MNKLKRKQIIKTSKSKAKYTREGSLIPGFGHTKGDACDLMKRFDVVGKGQHIMCVR